IAARSLPGGLTVLKRIRRCSTSVVSACRSSATARTSVTRRRVLGCPPVTPQYDDDLKLAFELADTADAITMRRYRAEDLAVETKPDLTPVSESDKAVELALRELLGRERPQDAVIGEEFGGVELANEGGRAWVIDPIDGTKSYVRGMDTWTTLIALLEGREVKL